MTIDEFERQVMTALLAGNHPTLETLREQYAAASVSGREMTATGFVTRFDVPQDVPAIERKLLHLDDLQLQLTGVSTPADVSVHVHNGRLRSFECFIYDGVFPETPIIEAAWYYSTERLAGITPELLAQRDLDDLLEDDE